MKGFFQIEEKQKVNTKNNCFECGLYKTCESPKMKWSGKGKKKILVIGEAPGKREDEENTQFVKDASAGKTIWKYFNSLGIHFYDDIFRTNAIICRPPKNRTPTQKEINLCRHNLFKTIEETNPEKVITFGESALKGLIGEKISVTGIGKWVGWKIPDQDLGCWIFPNYHPQYLNYNKDDVVLRKIFKNALREAIEWDQKFPEIKSEVIKLTKSYEASIYLDSLKTNIAPIAIDFETTGKKPQRNGHKILCMSICNESDKAIAFPIFDDKKFLFSLKRVLKNEKIKKIGQNIKFENIWAKKILKCSIKGWVWDTMIAAHCLDNRSGIIGLKFQTYINFGIVGYDKEIKKFMESKESNGFNKMDQVPLNDLLQYCGEDSIYAYNLFLKQKLDEDTIDGFNLFMKGQSVFSEMELQGIHTDLNYYIEQDKFLEKKLNILNKKIMNSSEVSKWEGKNFNFNSDQQLSKLLFDILKLKPIKETATGNNSVDASVLESLNLPFTNKILEYKKLYKIKNTYLAQFIRETEKGKIYPSFNLNLVKSFRSSSDSPNFQNIPEHDEQSRKITRTGIIPNQGNQLLEVDYKSIEVCISACYHHDPIMIDYINNPKTDMHKDVAKQIFMKKNISKEERYATKNNFVFPQFYGDYYIGCAKNLWKNSPKESILFSKYQKFENHLKDIEDDFWNNRFKVYAQWKKDIWREYQRKEKLLFHTGFVCTGHLDRKQIANFPIQGSAFHCLLWSLIQIQKYLKENKFKTSIIGQIHDSIIFDLCPDEKKELFPIIRKISTRDLREYYEWIIVPLNIDGEISEINGNWNEMKGIEI